MLLPLEMLRWFRARDGLLKKPRLQAAMQEPTSSLPAGSHEGAALNLLSCATPNPLPPTSYGGYSRWPRFPV